MAGRRFERSEKTSAKDVIDYEIRMLEHCAKRILAVEHVELDEDELAILEAFLLHFRILLEFFDEPSTNPRYKDNLQFQWPKSYGARPSAAAIDASKKTAKQLKDHWDEQLNKFLAHPTERRHTTKRSWPVEEMRDDMRKLIAIWRGTWGEPTI